MQPDAADRPASQAYFDTPERAERLQLVAHLIRNAEAVPYVRGQRGAGKTRFAERLAEIFRQEAALVELDGQAAPDVAAQVNQALDVSGEWPHAALDAVIDGDLVVLVDNADHLRPAALGALHALRAHGGRLVLLGASDPAQLSGQWNIQLIDLPPYSEEQARAFLTFLGHAEGELLKDAELARLCRMADGQPGGLLEALQGGRPGVSRPGRLLPWKWLLGSCVVLLVVLVLWQQEAINALFQVPRGTPAGAPASTGEEAPPQVASGAQLAIPPLPEPAPAPSPAGTATAEPVPEVAPVVESEPVPQAAAGPAAASAAREPATTEPAPVTEPTPATPVVAETAPEPPVAIARPAPPPAASAAPATHAPATPVRPPEVATDTAPASTPVPARAAVAPSGDESLAWLRSRQGGHYTLQLAGARDRASLDQITRQYRLPGNHAVFVRDLAGKPWYSLVYGDFPDRDAAIRARDALPVGLRGNEIWPRTFASIWEQLPAGPSRR